MDRVLNVVVRWRIVAILSTLLLVQATALSQGVSPPFDAAVIVGGTQAHFRGALDYDGDGATDLMSAWFESPASAVHVKGFRNVGGNFVQDWSTTIGGLAYVPNVEPKAAVATGDFNGDGRDDFVFSINQTFGYWLSNGAGAVPTITWVINEPALIDQALATDFTGDGLPDLCLREGMTLRVWVTHPFAPPTFGSSAVVGAGSSGRAFLAEATGDLVRDVGAFLLDSQGLTSQLKIYSAPNGVLQPPVVLAPSAVYAAEGAAGDIDGDGDEDIVLFGQVYCSVLRRVGPAAFVAEPSSNGSRASTLVDVDGDGDLDGVGIEVVNNLIFGSILIQVSSAYSVTLNDGTGAFVAGGAQFPCSAVNVFSNPDRVVVARDLDQDGDVDFAAGNTVYYQQDGRFPQGYAAVAGSRDFVDVDADGDLDLVPGYIVNPFLAAPPRVALNRGDGVFATPVGFGPPPPAGMAWQGPGIPGDFDADGDVDFIIHVVNPSPYLQLPLGSHLFANLGGGVFVDAGSTGATVLSGVAAPENALVQDLDGDGDLDVVSAANVPSGATGSSRIWWNQGAPTFAAGPELTGYTVVHAADMDGDTDVDFVCRTPALDVVILFAGPSGFTPGPVIDTAIVKFSVADFDGDGDRDVFAVGNLAAKLLLNAGNGAFGAPISYPGMAPSPMPWVSSPSAVIAADFDADGLTDVLSLSAPGATMGAAIMLRNGPNGSFGAPIVQAFQAFGAGDIDGDGDPDGLANGLVIRNNRFHGASAGYRLQYGVGIPGSAGIVPVLGELGPFRVGSTVELRLRGGLGGASAVLAVGETPANSPLLGGTLLVNPAFTIPIQLGGAPGVPGTGGFTLPFLVPPFLSGVHLFHQAGVFDAGALQGVSATNGLEIRIG